MHRRVPESLSVFYSGVPISLEYFAWGYHKPGKPNSLRHRCLREMGTHQFWDPGPHIPSHMADVYEQVRVFRGPQNAEGIPISLGKWGWGGPHITRDMGTGVPISRLHRLPHSTVKLEMLDDFRRRRIEMCAQELDEFFVGFIARLRRSHKLGYVGACR